VLRERQLAWDELDARTIAEDRLADVVTAVDALSSERDKAAALAVVNEEQRSEMAELRAALAQERAAHAETHARLAYRETPAGWVRWPLGVARRRLRGAS
jgi:hypothetical protein